MAGLCDVCNSDFDPASGYIISNRTVATSQSYWQDAIERNQRIWGAFFTREDEFVSVFDQLVRARAADTTAWAVCEACSELFVFDRDEARAHARKGTQPRRKENRIKVGEFVMFAAAGYERVHGSWPANVNPIPQVGNCDFCEKPVYEPEPVGFIDKDTLARHQATGVLDTPARPPHIASGVPTWTICMPCVALMTAKDSRRSA